MLRPLKALLEKNKVKRNIMTIQTCERRAESNNSEERSRDRERERERERGREGGGGDLELF